jgi:hypothetical protein
MGRMVAERGSVRKSVKMCRAYWMRMCASGQKRKGSCTAGLQHGQRNIVTRVRVEHLLARRVRGRADRMQRERLGEVLDVSVKSSMCASTTPASPRSWTLRRQAAADVRGDTGVDEDVVRARVGVGGDGAQALGEGRTGRASSGLECLGDCPRQLAVARLTEE